MGWGGGGRESVCVCVCGGGVLGYQEVLESIIMPQGFH